MLVSIIGGLGLFILGMAIMTDGLRALAGSTLRSVLAKATPTPARGAFWGAAITMIVQSSSATTMTTIGLVSAGLLTFPQAIGVVFGANVGTTGTGWLVALAGVKFSLTAYALPMVLAGALARLFGRGRFAGAGTTLAGFGLLLFGLTVMQEGMSDLATKINPADLPVVADGVRGWGGAIVLCIVGAALTAMMQSSSAAIAVTLSALHAGAISPVQAAALVIGQNLGTTISAGIASLGATTPARRTALAHVLFNGVTGVVFLLAFPLLTPIIRSLAEGVDPTILLASFHTVYNLVGVALLLPMVKPFARFIERIIPQREPMLTRLLDQSVLNVPAVAIEAARHTVAETLDALSRAIVAALPGDDGRSRASAMISLEVTTQSALEAMAQTRTFLSSLRGSPTATVEQVRLVNVLHALDHAARLAETAEEARVEHHFRLPADDEELHEAAKKCAAFLHDAEAIDVSVASPAAEPVESLRAKVTLLDAQAGALAERRRQQRVRIMNAAAAGSIAADEAIRRAETMRILDRLAYHMWRATVHVALPSEGERAESGTTK